MGFDQDFNKNNTFVSFHGLYSTVSISYFNKIDRTVMFLKFH